jgi:PHD/YefM family antitoxin component YafN of YafNO toxin-antitoxin module
MASTLQYLTNEKGRKTAVVLPLEEYAKLIEDLDDLRVIAERRHEETIPHEDFKRQLKRNGLSH